MQRFGCADERHVEVTSLTQEQQQLLVEEQLTVAERLAAGVGHELNNPLAYVLGNLRWANGELDPANPSRASVEEIRKALGEAIDGAERMERLIRSLQLFARRPKGGPPRAVELHRPVAVALSILSRELGLRARVHQHLAPDASVRGEESALGHVFLNLLSNAIQAIPEGDAASHTVTITSRAIEDAVHVTIEDDGIGMSPEVVRNLFRPFFTTRPVGQGTGLGLSTVRAIVRGFGGEIAIDSEPGRGTTVRLQLPKHTV